MERRVAHDEAMVERSLRRLVFRIHEKPHGPKLHLEDRMVSITSLWRRREAEDEAGLHLG